MVLTNCHPLSAPNSLPISPNIVNPTVWDIFSPSVVSHHPPIKIYLKDPKTHPNRPQYLISLKHRWGLKPLIDKLLDKEILKPTHSPCNTPILPALKPDGSYKLVQDLRVVNSAVLPTHPVVPNPHTLLSHIPSDTSYFSVLNLKDAFFIIPLHPSLPRSGWLPQGQRIPNFALLAQPLYEAARGPLTEPIKLPFLNFKKPSSRPLLSLSPKPR
jgi:hypothetical protein